MSSHVVVVAPVAPDRIRQYAQHIAEQSGSEEVALRWVDRLYAAIATLDTFPRRFALAVEDAHRSYEIRRLIFGNYLALYTIDDVNKTVRVIGFRHGARLPRPDELPNETS